MPYTEAQLSELCSKKTKLRCKKEDDGDEYKQGMYIHAVYPNGECSLGYKRGRGGYFEAVRWTDVIAPWDEPAADAAGPAADAAAPDENDDDAAVIADRTCAVMDAVGFWHDCRNQHSSVDAALLELLDNVADEQATRCEISVRAVDGGRSLAVGLRNDVRGPEVARVDQALTLAQSLKRAREHGHLIGENGVGLKAAAAKLGACAIVLSVHPAQSDSRIRREDGATERVPLGSIVFTVGVLAEQLQKRGHAPSLPLCSFYAPGACDAKKGSRAKAVAAAWRGAKSRPAGKLVEKVAKAQGLAVAEACCDLAAFCLDDAGAPRDASRPSAFEVVLAGTALPAHDLAGRLKGLLRGPTYLERGYAAVAVDPSGSETVAPHSLLRTLLEPARCEVKVGPTDDDVVTVLAGFSISPADVAAAARPSPLLVYTCGRLVERHDDWRLALDLEGLLRMRAIRKEYSYGLSVVIIDSAKVLKKTHTKQQIVDNEAFRAAKEAAARFATDYYVAVHKATWGGGPWRLDIATSLTHYLDECADRAAEREPLDPPRLRDANLVALDRGAAKLVAEDPSRPCDAMRLEALFHADRDDDGVSRRPRRGGAPEQPQKARPPPRAAAVAAAAPIVAPESVAAAARFGVGTVVDALFRGCDWYAAVVTSYEWLGKEALERQIPAGGPYAGARAVYAVRYLDGSGSDSCLFEESLRLPNAQGKRARVEPRRLVAEDEAAWTPPSWGSKGPQKKKAKKAAAPRKAAPKPSAGDDDDLDALKRELLDIEANGVAAIVKPAWRASRDEWVLDVRDARSPRSILELAKVFERDGWADEAKFATWLGDAAALQRKAAGDCPGMSRAEWLAKVQRLFDAPGCVAAADAEERLRELDFYSSDGAVARTAAPPPPATGASVDGLAPGDAEALAALLPARRLGDALHAARFPGLRSPLFVADAASDRLRAFAFASRAPAATGDDVVLKRGPPEKRRRVVEGVKKVVHVDANAGGDDAVTLKRSASDCIDVKAVGASDPRVGLRGQSKAVAKRKLAEFDVVGAYSGRLFTNDAFRQKRGGSLPGFIEHERYSYDLFLKDGDDATHATHLVIDPWPGRDEDTAGGPLMAINDCRVDPLASNAGQSRYNCEFCEVEIRGFPYLFVVASTDIAKGAELLIDYGQEYWVHRRAIEKYLATFRMHHPPEKLERLRRVLTAPRDE